MKALKEDIEKLERDTQLRQTELVDMKDTHGRVV